MVVGVMDGDVIKNAGVGEDELAEGGGPDESAVAGLRVV